ncbi:transcriptional antiterminator [Parashewanella spongiae]|uniref:Transcriptional antiterminator n=1 Tax=Parashewanella spongiae TaxID=342950 RepID=A0A3A6TYW8_9GAMM|nr:Rho-binding antiterminator [Parashewanella spongiae]MCL1077762.1 Rho-binding antiterminator [Parashewanella spongiae]RJY18160.1 transcriptional antiterminator [Parashewanella spongiae]
MMTPYQPISCSLYDQIELACIKGKTIKIELLDGSEITAVPKTTETHSDKNEYLVLTNAEQEVSIRLDLIAMLHFCL